MENMKRVNSFFVVVQMVVCVYVMCGLQCQCSTIKYMLVGFTISLFSLKIVQSTD